MSSQQFQENRGYVPQQADARSGSAPLGSGTDVVGQPVNPLSESAQTHTTSSQATVDPAATGERTSYAAVDPAATGTRAAPISPTYPPVSPNYDSRTPANASSYSQTPGGDYPSAQRPQSLSSTPSQSGPDQFAATSQQPSPQTTSHTPYVHTTSVPGSTGKTPMDSIMSVFNKWSKKAEDMTGTYWSHLRTGPNVADTAMGRLALGTRAISEGGLENIFRQTFEIQPDEHLLKTYACYLSTSTGPVAGTLYISTHKLAFCSDRPLAIPQSPGSGDAANQAAAGAASAPTKKASSAQQENQYCYYKVAVPISQVELVNPSENTQKKPPEKYVQVKTADGHEFWFMGFVNYDKGVKNLQEAVASKNVTSPTTNTTSHVDTSPTTNPPTYGDTNPSTNPPSYGDRSYADTNPSTNPPSYDDGSYADTKSHNNPSSFGKGTSTTNPYVDARSSNYPPSYDKSNATTNPSSYGDAPYADVDDSKPSTNPHSYGVDTKPTTDPHSYGADTKPATDPPSYADVNPSTNTSSHAV